MGDTQAQAAAHIEALDRLIEAVGADRDNENHHAAAFPSESAYGHCTWHDSHKAASGSLDAAKALQDALLGNAWMLPVWVPHRSNGKDGVTVELYSADQDGPEAVVADGAPAMAWLICILRAYRAKLAGGG